MLWDGQSYYCDARCLPDTAQSRAPFLQQRAAGDQNSWIEDPHITHVLIDLEGANFMLQHDPAGEHRSSLELTLLSLERCGELILSSDKTALYAWHCGPVRTEGRRRPQLSRQMASRELAGKASQLNSRKPASCRPRDSWHMLSPVLRGARRTSFTPLALSGVNRFEGRRLMV